MAQLLLANPRRRRRTTRRKTTSRKSPARRVSSVTRSVARVTRRYRRNPSARGGIMKNVQKGAIGAAGALAVDVAMQRLPIPDNLKSGAMAPAVKGLVGIGLGMAVAKLGKNKQLGEQLADGAITVALYNAGREMIGPQIGLSAYDDGLLGTDFDDDLGYYSAAPTYDGGDMGYYEDSDF